MVSPLSTENSTPGELISNHLASSLSDIPNSLTVQKQKRLLAFTYEYLLTLNSTLRELGISRVPHLLARETEESNNEIIKQRPFALSRFSAQYPFSVQARFFDPVPQISSVSVHQMNIAACQFLSHSFRKSWDKASSHIQGIYCD